MAVLCRSNGSLFYLLEAQGSSDGNSAAFDNTDDAEDRVAEFADSKASLVRTQNRATSPHKQLSQKPQGELSGDQKLDVACSF